MPSLAKFWHLKISETGLYRTTRSLLSIRRGSSSSRTDYSNRLTDSASVLRGHGYNEMGSCKLINGVPGDDRIHKTTGTELSVITTVHQD
ncbi:hypothetical protein F4678DRAFT_417408 [Xylaria arbuscula]|nr:hypothetical protein F4678DRAFT_417408 [Xylaria arbuscula]